MPQLIQALTLQFARTITTREPEPAFQFQCSLCLDDRLGVPIIVDQEESCIVDEGCARTGIVPLINAAKDCEYQYPPTWGSVEVEPRNFLHLLPSGFKREYRQKQHEYHTARGKRIYCRHQIYKEPSARLEQCGAFLGSSMSRMEATARHCQTCNVPKTGTCMHCNALVPIDEVLRVVARPHLCVASSPDDDADAFKGLERGEHYQVCPGCDMKVELMEACNALRCLGFTCQTDFCAICGQRAAHDSRHWEAGRPCPRWGKPSEANAQYDEPAQPEPPAEVEPIVDELWIATTLLREVEEAGWREQPFHHQLARDEAYLSRLIELFDSGNDAAVTHEFVGSLPLKFVSHDEGLHVEQDALWFCRMLKDLKITLRYIAAYRTLSISMTKVEVGALQNRYRACSFALTWNCRQIGERFMLRYPRCLDLLQRTLEKLDGLEQDITHMLIDYEAIGLPQHRFTDELGVPIVEMEKPLLLPRLEKAHDYFDRAREGMIQENIHRPQGIPGMRRRLPGICKPCSS